MLFFANQVDDSSCGTSTTGAAAAVDVVLFVLWCIEVNHHIDMVHMQTTSNHVSRHHGANLARCPVHDDAVTRTLGETTMQMGSPNAAL